MIRDANIEIVRGDAEVVLIPIRDVDSPDDVFVNPPDETNIRYVIASDFDPDLVIYEAETGQISTPEFGNVKPENPSLPDSFPPVIDTQPVVRIELSPSDTRLLTVTENNDAISPYVHECQITQSGSPSRKVTVMQGTVEVLSSLTTG